MRRLEMLMIFAIFCAMVFAWYADAKECQSHANVVSGEVDTNTAVNISKVVALHYEGGYNHRNRSCVPSVSFTNAVGQAYAYISTNNLQERIIICMEHYKWLLTKERWEAVGIDAHKYCARQIVLPLNEKTYHRRGRYDGEWMRNAIKSKPSDDILTAYRHLKEMVPTCGEILSAYWRGEEDLWTFYGIGKCYREESNHVWTIVELPEGKDMMLPKRNDIEVDVDI